MLTETQLEVIHVQSLGRGRGWLNAPLNATFLSSWKTFLCLSTSLRQLCHCSICYQLTMKENHPEQLPSCRDNGFCFLSYTDTGAVVKITILTLKYNYIYNICLKLISVNNWYLFYLVRLSLQCQFILFIVMCIRFCQV